MKMKNRYYRLLLVLMLCGCHATTPIKLLDIDVSKGTEIANKDTHSGFHGDGNTVMIVQFEDDSLETQIKESWQSMPMGKEVQTIVYGAAENDQTILPFFTDEKGNAVIPPIQNGYYQLIDQQVNQEKRLLERASFNFVLGIYDADTKLLYICECDT